MRIDHNEMHLFGAESIGPITETLANNRIVRFGKMSDGTFVVEESCDGFFSAVMAHDEFSQLIDELIKLRDR